MRILHLLCNNPGKVYHKWKVDDKDVKHRLVAMFFVKNGINLIRSLQFYLERPGCYDINSKEHIIDGLEQELEQTQLQRMRRKQ